MPIRRRLVLRKVRNHIYTRLEAAPTAWDIACDMEISVRTLQRGLAEEGTSYSQVLDELRREIAVRSLSRGFSDLAALAARLGYRQQSSFTRAMCRWTGKPPSEYGKNSMNRD